MKNFSELKTDVAVLAQRSGDTDYLTKIGVWLNMSHKLLAEIYDYWFELQDVYNFNATDGQESYGLPNRFDKPFRLYDITSNNKMTIKTEEQYFDENIANIADAVEGQPSTARIFGVQGVTTQISTSGDTVKVKSSSSTESAAIVIRVQGYVDSSFLIEDFENITIPAATASTYVAGTTTFYKITHVSKSANTTGYITVANSAGTVLDYISPVERTVRHKILKLGLIPNKTYAMCLLFKKTNFEMVSDYDYPFTECDRYLTLDALGWSYKQDTKDQQAEFVWGHAKEALQVLLVNQNSKLGPDYQHKITNVWLEAHRNR